MTNLLQTPLFWNLSNFLSGFIHIRISCESSEAKMLCRKQNYYNEPTAEISAVGSQFLWYDAFENLNSKINAENVTVITLHVYVWIVSSS